MMAYAQGEAHLPVVPTITGLRTASSEVVPGVASKRRRVQAPLNYTVHSAAASNDELTGADFHRDRWLRLENHRAELEDREWEACWKSAIATADIRGKVVLDVHAGLGHRSLLAAAAGAAAVYAVEPTWLAECCAEVVQANGCDVITVLRCAVGKGLVLPTATVDVILCSWAGPAALFDSLVATVIWARDRFLAAGGVILPNRATLSLVGAELVPPVVPIGWEAIAAEMKERQGGGGGGNGARGPRKPFAWGDVYGFDMSAITVSMRERRGRSREVFAGEYLSITEDNVLRELNLMECPLSDTSFVSRFRLNTTPNAHVNTVGDTEPRRCDGLVVSTTIHFDHCASRPSFTSGSAGSHIGGVFFESREPLKVVSAGVLRGKYQCIFTPTERPSGRASCDVGLLDVEFEGDKPTVATSTIAARVDEPPLCTQY